MKINKIKGFTLIELLVVISIISLLSSIVFSSVDSARTKAKDTSIIQEMKQFEVLLNLEYTENGSYSNLYYGGWLNSAAACNAAFGGNYAGKAREICKSIISKLPASGTMFYVGASTSSDYSINSINTNQSAFMCVGSRGVTSSCGSLTCAGCISQP